MSEFTPCGWSCLDKLVLPPAAIQPSWPLSFTLDTHSLWRDTLFHLDTAAALPDPKARGLGAAKARNSAMNIQPWKPREQKRTLGTSADRAGQGNLPGGTSQLPTVAPRPASCLTSQAHLSHISVTIPHLHGQPSPPSFCSSCAANAQPR